MVDYRQFHVVHLIDAQKRRKVVEVVKERHSPSGVVQLTRGMSAFNTQ